MNPRRLAALLLPLALLTGAPAAADVGMLMGGVANRRMPIDALTAPTACYSWRRLRTAYTANKAVNVVRASDSATTDIGFLADGQPDTATLTTFLNATTGKVVTWYDQCGARDMTQGTDASRPVVTLSCNNGYACASATSALTLVTANFTPASGIATLAAVGARSVGNGTCNYLRENGANNRLTHTSAAATWTVTGGTSGTAVRSATGLGFNAGVAYISGDANSLVHVNGVDGSTASVVGNTTAGPIAILGVASTTCLFAEAIVWDAADIGFASRFYLTNGQRIWGGF